MKEIGTMELKVKLTDEQILELQKQIGVVQCASSWRQASDVPSEDCTYEVCTREGAIFLSRPMNGKWMSNIVAWRELPPVPKDLFDNK